MTPEQLLQKVSDHEDNFVERKVEGVSASELRQTACAFANSVPEGREAVLLVGIHDKGQVLGVGNTDALQKRIRDACDNDCYPPIACSMQILDVAGKKVVAAVFPSSARRPHFSGPAYVRRGSESPKATAEQYEELILSRVDKAREIVQHRDQLFTVQGIGYKLGSNRPLQDATYKESRECRLLGCTAHLVTFEDINSGVRFSEPLAHTTITYDHEKWRTMVLVSFPK
ncbi:AlbA family DNA-binding domain-containing protein [Piscinibacter terrae]|nr:ATP-binding protein [Albitalea terrae]